MSKLTNIHRINTDAEDDLHVLIPDSVAAGRKELKFRETLDTLVDAFNDDTLDTASRIEKMLFVGQEYLSSSVAILYADMGDSLEMRGIVGELPGASIGTKIPLQGSFCSIVLDSDEPIALHDINNSEYAHSCAGQAKLFNAYIGTQVHTGNGPFGIVSFISNDTKTEPFDDRDKRIVTTIATWSGMLIGSDEQLEFLAQQNDYYRSLFGTVPSMMMLCNEDGLILSSSDRLSTEIGLPSAKLPGNNCQTFFESCDAEALNKALAEGEVSHLPLTLQRTNGETLEVELNSCIKAIGSMQGVRMMVLSDVSERNKAMREVEAQIKQLALANQSLNQFAVIASHDLQEPLQKIEQFSHFLAEDLEEVMTPDSQHHLNVIDHAAKHMSTLIKDLLRFSSAAQEDLVVSEVNLESVLNEVLDHLELRIAENNAKISVSELPTVQGDKGMIRQLFTNLISNSLKYRDSTRDPIIDVQFSTIDDKSVITISDNGIGFDQKLATRAFEPFSRLHTSKEYTGNGIGLSICSTVCDKHNWSLSAKSQPGKGTVFSIKL